MPAVLMATGAGAIAGLGTVAPAGHAGVRAASATAVPPLTIALPGAPAVAGAAAGGPAAAGGGAAESSPAGDDGEAAREQERRQHADQLARAAAASRASRARRAAADRRQAAAARRAAGEKRAAAARRAAAERKAAAARRIAQAALRRHVRPSKGVLTSKYGPRWGRLHAGIDFGAPSGSPVRAVAQGKVVDAGHDAGGYGNFVHVRHSDGTVTTYNHLSVIRRRSGAVRPGDVVGLVGSTGRSTGPHLHLEVHVDGDPVDPLPWLRKHGVKV